MMPAHLEEIKRSAVRAGALTALTRAKAWISDLDPADIENGYPSIKEDGSAFDNEDLRALTREMHSLSSKLAEEIDLSFHQSIYDAHNNRVNTPGYETPTLILPIRKHTYAPEVDPSNLISDEAAFKALTRSTGQPLTSSHWIERRGMNRRKMIRNRQASPSLMHKPEADLTSSFCKTYSSGHENAV